MNRIVLGAVSALLLAAAGLFWWQGRADLESRAPALARNRAAAGGLPIELPGSDTNGARGPGLPSAASRAKTKEGKQERRFNRYDKNRDGTITRNEMLVTRVKAFQKLDSNHDNLLTFEEWAVKTANRFREIDRNGDGIISRAELDAYNAVKDNKPAKPRCGCGAPRAGKGAQNPAASAADDPELLDAPAN